MTSQQNRAISRAETALRIIADVAASFAHDEATGKRKPALAWLALVKDMVSAEIQYEELQLRLDKIREKETAEAASND